MPRTAVRKVIDGIRRFTLCHLPGWPFKRCAVCGRMFLRRPWYYANPFEEHCSRKCADDELAFLDSWYGT